MNPALTNKSKTEFFISKGELFCIHEMKITSFNDAPLTAIDILSNALENDVKAQDGLTLMGIHKPVERLKVFASCRFGALDQTPDFTNDKQADKDELIDCVHKHTCKGFGLVCKKKFTCHSGEALSAREVQIGYMRAKGMDSEAIAKALFIEPISVRSTLLNIKQKLNLQNCFELVSFFVNSNVAVYDN